jgi:mRNA interferase HigB
MLSLRRTFPSADLVGSCYVFNVNGNRYRVITKISFGAGVLTIREVPTHEEYDRERWKNGCNC